MPHYRYLEFILTVIALELLWLGVRDTAPRVSAQAPAAPTAVVITGVEIEGLQGSFLPVGIVGSYRTVPPRAAIALNPLTTRVDGNVRIQVDRPIKVEADKPLPVQQVDYTPRARPGE